MAKHRKAPPKRKHQKVRTLKTVKELVGAGIVVKAASEFPK